MQKKLRLVSFVLFLLFALLVVPIMRYRKEANLNSLPSRFLKGVYVVDSDLAPDIESGHAICETAKEQALDFVVLTPKKETVDPPENRAFWCNNTLMAIASTGLADLEIFNLQSSLSASSLAGKIIPALRYLFNPRYALLQTLSPPTKAFSEWDLRLLKDRVTGIYSLGKPGGLPGLNLSGTPIPTYRAMCAIFTVYVRIERELVRDPGESSEILTRAIRSGHFFNAVEAMASANGFDARFNPQDSQDEVQMGDRDPRFQGILRIDLPFTFPTRLKLIRNGSQVVDQPSGLRQQVNLKVNNPGVYRLEIYVPNNRFSAIPWIVTNPFYLGFSQS